VSDGCESRAEEWLAWARTPDHDAYWRYRDAFAELLPPPRGRTLEISCGEGRVTHGLAARAHRVTAIDASPTLLAAATAADPGGEYVVARAESLPFADGSFALVVAYDVLMDVADLDATLGQCARVLAPGGTPVRVRHPSARRRRALVGRREPLESYAQALAAAGLAIEAIREPAPASDEPEWERWRRIPMFLMLRAVRPAG
jgi:ubiquinone/menaquinone biosynthesis C-methylase UbiE